MPAGQRRPAAGLLPLFRTPGECSPDLAGGVLPGACIAVVPSLLLAVLVGVLCSAPGPRSVG